MPGPSPIPSRFLAGPFHRDEFVEAGLSPKSLLGKRFQRVFPNVWAPVGELTHHDRIAAARLSMPSDAAISHITRIQVAGLDIGDRDQVHLTVPRDLHLDTAGVFLHRTVAMPPLDTEGVTPAAAFVQCSAEMKLIDLVVIGDWLLRSKHMSLGEVREVAAIHPWRPGAEEVQQVLPLLDPASASPKESQLRVLMAASGLPNFEINAPVFDALGQQIAIVDVLFRDWALAVEYEGRQHAETPQQFSIDLERYARLRQNAIDYVQVTAKHLASPRALMMRLHQRLVARGYTGPPPRFEGRWFALFVPIPGGESGPSRRMGR